ncbi:MAG: carbohydrate porin [Alphaproteobacteria bacterium]
MISRKTVAGPTRHFVDAAGRYGGQFHDAVDDKGEVVHPVKVPEGFVEVVGPPPGDGYLWQGGTWKPDPDYEPPTPQPTVKERLAAIEARLAAIEAQLAETREIRP